MLGRHKNKTSFLVNGVIVVLSLMLLCIKPFAAYAQTKLIGSQPSYESLPSSALTPENIPQQNAPHNATPNPTNSSLGSATFRQMPVLNVVQIGDGLNRNGSSRSVATIRQSGETAIAPTVFDDPYLTIRQSDFVLKTKPISLDMVEASRRAINANHGSQSTGYAEIQTQSSRASEHENSNAGKSWNLGVDGSQIRRAIATSREVAPNRPSNAYYSEGYPSKRTNSEPGHYNATGGSVKNLSAHDSNENRSVSSSQQTASYRSDEVDYKQAGAWGVPSKLDLDGVTQTTQAQKDLTKKSESAAELDDKKNRKSDKTVAKKFSVSGTVQRVATSTILILVVCVVSILVLKKLGYKGPAPQKTEQAFDIIETATISNKCQLQLVKIQNHKVIVGIDQTGIKSMICLPHSFVDEFDDATAITDATRLSSSTQDSTSSEVNQRI